MKLITFKNLAGLKNLIGLFIGAGILFASFQNCSSGGFNTQVVDSLNSSSSSSQSASAVCTSGQTQSGYALSAVVYPLTCGQLITKTCVNGQWNRSEILYASCKQQCVHPDSKQAVDAGTVYYSFSISSASSQSACDAAKVTSTCSQSSGTFSPAIASNKTCLVAGQTCAYTTGSGIANPSGNSAGSNVKGYLLQSATYPKLCGAQVTSTCQASGAWNNGAPLYTSCAQKCLHPDSNQPVDQSTSYVYYTLQSGTQTQCTAAKVTSSCSASSGLFSPAPAATRYSSCTVLSAPVISSFSASSTSITAGASATLSWSVTGATSLSISGIGSVTGTSTTVTPAASTTYTLTATNTVGSSTKPVTITVSAAGGGSSDGGSGGGASSDSSAADEFTFLAYGDSRAERNVASEPAQDCAGNKAHISLVSRMVNEPASFVVHLGDMVAGFVGSTTNWVDDGQCVGDGRRGSLKKMIEPLQARQPASSLPTFFIPVIGNHDDSWSDGGYPDKYGGGFCDVFPDVISMIPNHTTKSYFAATFGGTTGGRMEDRNASQTGFYDLLCSKTRSDVYPNYMYYSFDVKNTHFVVLRINSDYYDLEENISSCATTPRNYQKCYYIHQLDWLRADLAQAALNTNLKNTVVFLHAPLFTTSDGHSDNASAITLRKLFSQHKVKMVLQGHNHVYERSYPVRFDDANPQGVRDDTNGTVYTTSGGGGSYFHGFRSGTHSSLIPKQSTVYHYLKINVKGTALTVQALKADGSVIDSYTK